MDNEMFIRYIELLAMKNRWISSVIEFDEFETYYKNFCKDFDLHDELVLNSLDLFSS